VEGEYASPTLRNGKNDGMDNGYYCGVSNGGTVSRPCILGSLLCDMHELLDWSDVSNYRILLDLSCSSKRVIIYALALGRPFTADTDPTTMRTCEIFSSCYRRAVELGAETGVESIRPRLDTCFSRR
jgi:hypothetical protein